MPKPIAGRRAAVVEGVGRDGHAPQRTDSSDVRPGVRLVAGEPVGTPVLLHLGLVEVPPAADERRRARSRSRSWKSRVVAVVVLLDDLEAPPARRGCCGRPARARSGRRARCARPRGAGRRPRRGSGRRCRSAGGRRRGSPRASSTTSSASDSLPSASTVASSTPSGRWWAGSGPLIAGSRRQDVARRHRRRARPRSPRPAAVTSSSDTSTPDLAEAGAQLLLDRALGGAVLVGGDAVDDGLDCFDSLVAHGRPRTHSRRRHTPVRQAGRRERRRRPVLDLGRRHRDAAAARRRGSGR